MLDPDIQALVEMGDLIAAIGLYQRRHGGSTLVARKAIDGARQRLATAAGPDAPVISAAPITQVNDPEVDALLRRGEKIAAIKRYRELHGVGLKDAKDAVEAMQAGQPVSHPTAQPSTATDAPQLQPELDRLIAANQKILAIKHYREVTRVGLKEAKDAVEAHMAGTARAQPRGPGLDLQPELDRLIAANQKIPAIKHYRQFHDVGLKEAKDAVEARMTEMSKMKMAEPAR